MILYIYIIHTDHESGGVLHFLALALIVHQNLHQNRTIQRQTRALVRDHQRVSPVCRLGQRIKPHHTPEAPDCDGGQRQLARGLGPVVHTNLRHFAQQHDRHV